MTTFLSKNILKVGLRIRCVSHAINQHMIGKCGTITSIIRPRDPFSTLTEYSVNWDDAAINTQSNTQWVLPRSGTSSLITVIDEENPEIMDQLRRQEYAMRYL